MSGNMTLELQSPTMVSDDLKFDSAEAVERYLLEGNCLFNVFTNEYVFFDPDFDDDQSFGISPIDMSHVDGDIHDGYSSSRDYSIDRLELCRRVLSENGWGDTSRDRIETFQGCVFSDSYWLARGISSQPHAHGINDMWGCATDHLQVWIAIPRRGESTWPKGTQLDVPHLMLTRPDGSLFDDRFKKPRQKGPDGNWIYPRIPRDGTLPQKVREWAAKEALKQVFQEMLPKKAPTLDHTARIR